MQHPTPSFLSTRHATNKYLGKMKEVRWGIIGCDEVTEKKSYPAFNEVEGSHVEAVFSRNETKARSYAERHHVRKWYTDPQELILDPDINAIYVATPPAAHTTFAIMSMRAGKPCYVEKPLAASYEDCIRINHISEQTGVRCYVAYYRRYLPYFKKVKTLINSGVLGKIMTVQVRLIAPPKPQDAQTGSLPLASPVQHLRWWLLLRPCPPSNRPPPGLLRHHHQSPWLQGQPRRSLCRGGHGQCRDGV